ncbi:MAG TPA: SRPBCC family protein [Actinomycetales bacterium]|jgi:uncharacterized protein YndB with AHSA1/START domain
MPDAASTGRTAVARAAIDLPGDPAEVFAFVADVSRHPLWSPRALRITGLPDDGALAVGSSFVSHGVLPGDKDHRNDVVVVELDPPRLLVLESTDASGTYRNTFRVSPRPGGGSHLDRELELPRPAGLLGVTTPVFVRLVMARDLQKGLRLLARASRAAG